MKAKTNPPIIIEMEGVDLTGADWIRVTLKRRSKAAVELTESQIMVAFDENVSTVTIPPEVTDELLRKPGLMLMDVNWAIDGARDGIEPFTVMISDTALTAIPGDEIISGGDG